MGFASESAGSPPPKCARPGVRDERPGHRLDETGSRQRPFGRPDALLQRGQHRRRHALMFAREGPRRHAVEAGDAHDLLDEIGFAFNIRPPGRNLDDEAIAVARRAAEFEAKIFENPGHFGRVEFAARSAAPLR